MKVKHPTTNEWKSMNNKIREVEELQISEQELGKTIKKREIWSLTGIDRMSNF